LILHNTRGIVLRSLKYSESSLIVKIYTEAFGLQSYLIKGASGRKARLKPVFFQPLNLLDLVVYRKEKVSLQTIREARFASIYMTVPQDIRKSSVILFLDEVLNRALGEEESNQDLFGFLWNSLLMLDTTQDNVSHFHLLFLVKLTRYLGFFPRSNHSGANPFFNLTEGFFQPVFNAHEFCLDERMSTILAVLMKHPLDHPRVEGITVQERDEMLEKLIRYYQLHLPGFHGIRSHDILRSVLS
jgi:DNA repair protein RecO (recombination protein O)